MNRFLVSLLMLCAVSPLLRAAEVEDQLVKKVEALNGGVKRDKAAPGSPVIAVLLFNTKTADADLKMLAGFRQIQKLDLLRTPVTDAGMADIAVLATLRDLDLGGTAVTDAGLK